MIYSSIITYIVFVSIPCKTVERGKKGKVGRYYRAVKHEVPIIEKGKDGKKGIGR